MCFFLCEKCKKPFKYQPLARKIIPSEERPRCPKCKSTDTRRMRKRQATIGGK